MAWGRTLGLYLDIFFNIKEQKDSLCLWVPVLKTVDQNGWKVPLDWTFFWEDKNTYFKPRVFKQCLKTLPTLAWHTNVNKENVELLLEVKHFRVSDNELQSLIRQKSKRIHCIGGLAVHSPFLPSTNPPVFLKGEHLSVIKEKEGKLTQENRLWRKNEKTGCDPTKKNKSRQGRQSYPRWRPADPHSVHDQGSDA